MESITVRGGALFATTEDRTLRGLLLPYGEVSRQSPTTAPIAFDRGTVKIPRDVSIVSANVNHSQFAPVARATDLQDTEKGIVAVFKVAETDEGDQLLDDVKQGKLSKLSAELTDIVREGAKGLHAKLTGAAFVPEGAFASAGIFSIEISDLESSETLQAKIAELEAELEATRAVAAKIGDALDTETTDPAPAESETPATFTKKEDPVADATVPNTLQATAPVAEVPVSKREAFAIFQSISKGEASPEQIARLSDTFIKGQHAIFALNDVKYTGSGSIQPDERRPQWIDEVWSGRTYQQKVVPLFGHQDLTSKTVSGFRWTTKPSGATWAGNKANISSNTPVTEAVSETAVLWAGGHDHALEHQIFDTPGYFESYFAAMADSYAAWVDAKVLTDALADATALEADNPSGLSIGAGFSALIDGATAVIEANALPTFALVAPALWKSMMKVPSSDALAYLTAALGLEEGNLDGFTIRPHASLSTGNILVGAREALTVYELPGLIRVTAPDTVKGGIDTNVVGAAATVTNKATALQLVTPYTP